MADTKISAETSAGALDGTEIVPVVRGTGSPPVYSNLRTTIQDIANRAALELIATRIASASAALDWTGLDVLGFDYFELVFNNLIPVSAGASLYAFFGTGAGPTYETSNYQYAASIQGTTGTYIGVALTGQARIPLFDNIHAGLGLSGRHTFMRASAQLFGQATGRSSADNHWYQMMAQGTWTGGTALTALRLAMSAGNIASGKASLYGIRS